MSETNGFAKHEEKPPSRIFICQPQYKNGEPASHRQFWVGATKNHHGRCDHIPNGGSLLALCFNQFWCAALNAQKDGHDIGYFAMLHDDIIPQDGWIDILMEDLESSGADVVSAVVPIKDPLGLTSTAIDDPDDKWNVMRRISMTEAFNLPEVFSGSDCGYRDDQLLINTGCWICRFDKPWREKVYFTIQDAILKDEASGTWGPRVAPEDWNFSRMIHANGGTIRASRRVKVQHVGACPWNNHAPWGEWTFDQAFAYKIGNKEIMGTKEDFAPGADNRLSGSGDKGDFKFVVAGERE